MSDVLVLAHVLDILIDLLVDRGYLYEAEREYFNGYLDKFRREMEEAGDEAVKLIKAWEQQPCEDAINRAELLKAIDTWDKFGVDDTNSLFRLDNLSLPHYVPYIHYDDVIKCIKGMPSVTPKQKMGHWVKTSPAGIYECSECGHNVMTGDIGAYRHCHGCGAKMSENVRKRGSR